MTELVALRPKLYSYSKLNGAEDKRCVVNKTISLDDDKNCLFDAKTKSIYWRPEPLVVIVVSVI